MTFSQYHLYLESLVADRKRDLKERAVASRLAWVDGDGWKAFLNALDNNRDDGMDELFAAIDAAEPKSNVNEGEIEWLKSISKSEPTANS